MSEPQNSFQESDYQQMLDSMFREQDEKLWKQLRAEMAEKEEIEELSKATGIKDHALIMKLLDMGVNAHSLAALTMYPMVSVAYADGVLNVEERDLILKWAHDWNLKPGEPGYQLLENWLKKGPTEDGFAAWKKYMGAILAQMTPQQQEDIKRSVIDRSRAVADAVGDILGRFGNRTSRAEKARLAEIEAIFA